MLTNPSMIINQHLKDVRSAEAVGATVTERHRDLGERWLALLAHQPTAIKRLRETVINGDMGTLESDYLEAYAEATEATSNVKAASAYIVQFLAPEMLNALREEYAKVSVSNYDAAAKRYRATAGRLVKALELVDADDVAESFVGATKAKADAWLGIPLMVKELEASLSGLTYIATLAGVPNAKSASTQIALAVDAKGLHRRRVWEAWEITEGRAGKWGALVQLGANLHAPAMANLQPYREPAAIVYRNVPLPAGGYRLDADDPEDREHAAV